jgi:TolB-like protein
MLVVLVVLVVSAAPDPSPQSAEKRTILVVPLHNGPGVDKGVADLVTETLCAEVQRQTGFRILTSKDVEAVLGVERQRQLLGCTENSSCLTEIGGALGAADVIHGTLGKLGSSYIFNLQLVNAGTGQVTRRFSTRSSSTSEETFLDLSHEGTVALFAAEGTAEAAEAGAGTPGAQVSSTFVTSHGFKRLFVALRGNVGLPVQDASLFTSFATVTAGLQVTPAISVSAGFLTTLPVGVMARGAYSFNAAGRVRPTVGLEVPVVFTPGTPAVGAALAPGVTFELLSWLSLFVDVPLTFFFTGPADAPRFYLFAALGAAVRFL